MNQAAVDNALLISSLATAIVLTKCLRSRKAGPVFSTCILFPPLLVFLNMWAHTVAVIVVNIQRYLAGSFQYSFTVYSYLLFGIVFILLSGTAIHFSKKYILGDRQQKRTVYLLNLATALSFLPVGFINPIGFLPVLAAIFSSVTLLVHNPFRKYQMKEERQSVIVSNSPGRAFFQKQ